MIELFFDTETSGFDKSAWIIQLAFHIRREGRVIAEMSTLIQGAGREMPEAAQDVHGISVEAAEDGIPENLAMKIFMTYASKADRLIAHNYSYDCRMLHQALKRCGFELSSQELGRAEAVCTMKASTKYCGLRNKIGRAKWPKLIELHEKLFSEGFDGAHDALADVHALVHCYDDLRERGII